MGKDKIDIQKISELLNEPFYLLFILLCVACVGNTYCQCRPDSLAGATTTSPISRLLTGQGYVEIPMKGMISGQWVVEAMAKNRKMRFLIDTGASHSAINKQVADSLQFPIVPGKHARIQRIDSSASTEICIAESIQIGGILVDKMEMAVNTSLFVRVNNFIQNNRYNVISNPWGYMNDTDIIDSFDGILGNDFLLKYAAIIDLQSVKIYLRRH